MRTKSSYVLNGILINNYPIANMFIIQVFFCHHSLRASSSMSWTFFWILINFILDNLCLFLLLVLSLFSALIHCQYVIVIYLWNHHSSPWFFFVLPTISILFYATLCCCLIPFSYTLFRTCAVFLASNIVFSSGCSLPPKGINSVRYTGNPQQAMMHE